MLIAVPQRAPITSIASFVQHQMDHEANVLPSTCGDLAVCIEIDQMPVEHVAMSILQMQPDCAELISRLPDDANALIVLNAEAMYESPIGKREGWRDLNRRRRGARATVAR